MFRNVRRDGAGESAQLVGLILREIVRGDIVEQSFDLGREKTVVLYGVRRSKFPEASESLPLEKKQAKTAKKANSKITPPAKKAPGEKGPGGIENLGPYKRSVGQRLGDHRTFLRTLLRMRQHGINHYQQSDCLEYVVNTVFTGVSP